MEDIRAYIHIAYGHAFTRIKNSDYERADVIRAIEFSPSTVLRHVMPEDSTSSETNSDSSNPEDYLDSSHQNEIIDEIIKFFDSDIDMQVEAIPYNLHIDIIREEFENYFIWSYDELERYGVVDIIEERMRKYNVPKDMALDLACYDVETRIREIDFDDEFHSFFNYIISLGYLATFEEQYYWIGKNNAYDILLRPMIMQLIQEEKSQIRKVLL